ncbi:MAG: lipopolysaccharide kinase InaA family protein [Candidatus Bathyarchaeia archaeon]
MQTSPSETENLNRRILAFCRHIAGSSEITAISLSEDGTGPSAGQRVTLQVLLVLKGFPQRLMSYPKLLCGQSVVVIAVEQWIFERDVDRGFLGEAIAASLVFPYSPVVNAGYLRAQEVVLKRRLILEMLENIAIGFPELSHRICIEPEYFMYAAVLNRVRLFPPMAYGVSAFLCDDVPKEKVGLVLGGYLEALRQLEKARLIRFEDGAVMLSKEFVADSRKPRVRLTNISKTAPRALFSSFFGLYPQLLNFLAQNTEVFFKLQKFPWRTEPDVRGFVDPQRYVYVPTARGLVSLADNVDIKTFAQRLLKDEGYTKIKVEEFGGVLNDLYLIQASAGGSKRRILVKRFKDWSGFKWFPLSIWSVGARSFAVLGKSRLERELAISEILAREGFAVPKVLHVNASERLVFMEFIEGENLSNAIKRIAASQSQEKAEKDLAYVAQIGGLYARVHSLNVTLGDTKPENAIVDSEGKVYLLDFEQGNHDGDKAWDVAEFLYYSGHYVPLKGESKAEAIANAFTRSYLNAGGNLSVVKNAGLPKYTRVFSVFTLPSVIRVMSNVCRKTEAEKR